MEKNMSRPTVTLCMIVKNESHIIHESLQSMLPYIDRYDISDTGSTDNTKEIIKEFFAKHNIPGEVHDIPWEGFGKSRTRSLRNCDGKADYAWVIDADDRMTGDFKFPPQFGEHWAYSIKIHRGDFEWWRNQIFKTGVGWEYVGVLHEYANCPSIEAAQKEQGRFLTARLDGNYALDARTMGARTKEFETPEGQQEIPGQESWRKKYLKDAETILDCLTNPDNPNYEPNNHRYFFYLAQSYFDGGDYKNAKEWYTKRAELGGWEEEQWYSVLRVAMCMSNLGERWQDVQDVFLQAWNLRPTRVEPLYNLARIHRMNGNPRLGYLFAKMGCTISFPRQDVLFVAKDLYSWQIYDELASTAWYAGDMQAGLAASNKLLSEKLYPQEQGERIMNNWKNYVKWHEEQEKAKQEHEQRMLQQKIAVEQRSSEQSETREKSNLLNKKKKERDRAKKARKLSRR